MIVQAVLFSADELESAPEDGSFLGDEGRETNSHTASQAPRGM